MLEAGYIEQKFWRQIDHHWIKQEKIGTNGANSFFDSSYQYIKYFSAEFIVSASRILSSISDVGYLNLSFENNFPSADRSFSSIPYFFATSF